MPVNNLELIKPLLNFETEGDFYMLYIFKRKKDQPEGEKENAQSVRTIKTYCVESLEYFDKRWDEITHLCEYFKARAYIHVQKQNHKDVGLNMLAELAIKMRDGAYKCNHIFDSVVGQLKTYEKRWIVDVDNTDDRYLESVIQTIYYAPPVGNKVVTKIPTKNGLHLITEPFNVQHFTKCLDVLTDVVPDIQKKNPTLLFLPDSLM